MLEIGYNVVVLSLEDYEKLKKRAEEAEAQVREFEEAIKVELSWNKENLQITADGQVIQKIVEKKYANSKIRNYFDFAIHAYRYELKNWGYFADIKTDENGNVIELPWLQEGGSEDVPF